MKYELWWAPGCGAEPWEMQWSPVFSAEQRPSRKSPTGYHFVVKEEFVQPPPLMVYGPLTILSRSQGQMDKNWYYQVSEVNEYLATLSRNGYRLDGTQTVPPKPSVPEVLAPSPVLPSTLRELGNSGIYPNISPLERAVGQLLASGCVTSSLSQTLLKHLKQLAQVCGTLRQHLQSIPDDKLRQADELVAGKK